MPKKKQAETILIGVRRQKNSIENDYKLKDEEQDVIDKLLDLYNEFYFNLNKVDDFFKFNNALLAKKYIDADDKIEKYISNNTVRDLGDRVILGLSKKEYKDFDTNYKHKNILEQRELIIPKSTLIYFHSLLENFISKFLTLLFNNNPEQFKDDGFKFNFNQLIDFDTIDDAKDFLINKKINDLLWEPIDRQIKEIFSLVGISKEDEKFFPINELIEISLRRNIFTHNDGIVNDIYLDKCKQHSINVSFKKDDKITFDESYFTYIYDVYYEFLIKITFKSWIRLSELETKTDDAIGSFLNNIIVEIIVKENYSLGLKLISCILDSGLVRKINEESKLYFFINKALIYKIQDKKEDVSEILSGIDWSSQPNLLHFAKNVLSEDWGEATIYFKLITRKKPREDSDFISYNEIHNWPLFFEYKKTDNFKKAYKVIFKEEFIVDSED